MADQPIFTHSPKSLTMKIFTKTLFVLMVVAISIPSYAAPVAIDKPAEEISLDQNADKVTLDDFMNFSPQQIEERTGEKLNFFQKTAVNMLQKKMKKAKKKALKKAEKAEKRALKGKKAKKDKPAGGGNTLGLISFIAGLLGFIMLWFGVGALLLLSLLLGITAIITGAMGIKRDDSPVFAIIGLVFGILIMVLFLLAIVVIASFLAF
jgi:uncharacterized cupredoxin-like copper-binding protein